MLCFSEICFFQNFDRSNLFFDQLKLRLKTLVSLCPFRSMLDWYLFNRSIFVQSNLIFDQSKNRFDRSKMLQLIQYQSSTDQNRQRLIANFYCNSDQLKYKFDQSKFWKNKFFEKHSIIMQKLLKALNFMKKKTWVWDEMLFQKHLFWTQFSQN